MCFFDRRRQTFHVLLAVVGLLGAAPTVFGGTWIAVNPDGAFSADGTTPAQAPEVVVHWYGDTGLDVSIHLAGIELARESTESGEFVRVTCPKTPIAGDLGMPALPVVRRLFGVPEGATVDLHTQESESSIVDLSSLGFAGSVMPMQRPISLDPQAMKKA